MLQLEILKLRSIGEWVVVRLRSIGERVVVRLRSIGKWVVISVDTVESRPCVTCIGVISKINAGFHKINAIMVVRKSHPSR